MYRWDGCLTVTNGLFSLVDLCIPLLQPLQIIIIPQVIISLLIGKASRYGYSWKAFTKKEDNGNS